jgi:hypothetical protein
MQVTTFQATGDDGRTYTVRAIARHNPSVDHSEGRHHATGGIGRLEILDGRTVNRLGKGQYEIAGAGIKLRSKDPKAP